MNTEQRKIWQYLKQHAQGRKNHKSAPEIRKKLCLPSKGKTDELTRNLIRDMILEYNCCIGSDNNGFWLIKNRKELDDVVTSLRGRAYEISKRAKALEKNWDDRDRE